MNYINMVNSLDLLIFAIFLISFVLIQTLGFMKKGWNEALRLGVSKEDLKKTVKNSIGISILPSIPIVITAFVMITCLGVPLSWLRTTLIGSEGMELLCATMVAESVGVQFSPAGMNTTAYVNGAWVMTIGASICLLYAIIFVKPICSKIDKIRNKDAKWVTIFSLCAIVAIMSESVVSNSKKGPIQFICVISCFIFSYLFNVISKKEKLGWVQEFAFPVTLILGLIVGGIATPFFQ